MRLKESLISRRNLMTGLIGGALASIAGYVLHPLTRFLFHSRKMPLPKAVTLPLSSVRDMAPNSAAYFQYGRLPGILLKTQEGELRAFSAKCTHLDCTIQYHPDEKKFFCACHDGYFDDTGMNIAGPPPRPLDNFSMQESGDTLVLEFQGEQDIKHA